MKHATKTLAVIAALLVFSLSAMGQLTGPKAIPGDYASVAAAITDLNTQGVGAGGVTFNVAAGYTETLPSLTAGLITASGTVANSIVFQKSGAGANPLLTAFSPGASTTVDYIIAIAGGDYVTFDGIDLQENALNTTATMQMEWGYALVKASAATPFDGCQNVTIKNCAITLNKANTASVGIYTGNHVSTITTSLTITATTDASNNCKFFGNSIQNVYFGIKLNGFAASTPFTLYDQNNEIGFSSANIITNFGGGSVAAYGIYAVYQNNLKIDNNTVNGGTATTGAVYGIYTSTGTSSNVEINGNLVTVTSGGTTGALYGIYNGMGSTALGNTANINNNTLQNCTYTTATSATFYGIYNAASPATANMIGNNVTGNVIPGTGTMYLLYGGSPTNLNMTNNTVTNNQKTGAGTLYCTYALTSVVTYSGNNVTGNTGGSSIYGYYDASSPTVENIYNNRIAQLTGTGTGTIYGIYSNAISTTALAVYGNTVDSLVSAGGTIYGIYNAAGGTVNIYQNNLFMFVSNAAGSLVYGLYVSSGADVRLYNNFVSDLQAPVATGTNAVNGIYIAGGTAVGAYYNTVYLNAVSSSATTFGTSGIYVSTTPTVDLRNNIIVNVSIPGPTGGFTVAHRRSTTTLTTYASASNSNDFYVSTSSGVQRYYYSHGTTADDCDSTFPAYKARVASRDGSSFAENPPFVNPVVAPYDLHMQTTIPTQTESGASPVSSPVAITVDYDGTTRNAATPDVGADEFVGPALDLSPPAIAYTPLGNTANLASPTFAPVTITDATGVNIVPGTRPRVYYKRTLDPNVLVDNTNLTPGWKYTEATGGGGSPFSFTLNYALLTGGTGVVVGDTVQYFVVAQDVTPAVNVGINSGVFATQPASVALTPLAFPITGTINSYRILASISGTFTVGTTGAYPTITAAVTDLNNKVMTGAVTFLLIDPTYPTETFPITINQNGGSSGTNVLTIKPNTGVTTTVSGLSAASMFKLNGADYVVIDGSNSGTSSQDMSITNTSVGGTVVWISSLGPGLGATNNTIKNCIITGGSNASGNYGITVSGSTIAATGADNDNTTIQNNAISKAYVGIWAQGSATTNPGLMDNLQILGNSLGSSIVTDYLGHDGIIVAYGTGGTISQNTVYNIIGTPTTPVGITLSTGFVSATISRNKVNNITYTGTGGYGGRGFYVNTGNASSALTFSNNVVYQIGGDGWTTFSGSSMVGMYFDGITGGLNIYFNSVYMSGLFTRATASLTTAILFNTTTITSIDLRNNIFQNSMDNTGMTTDKNYAIYSTAPAGSFININRNDYFVTGLEGVLGYLGADQTTLAAWQTATGQDANSLNADPAFFSVNDLRVFVGSPVLAAGVTIPGITIDYLGVTRGSPPSMGAYENGVAAGKPNPALIVSPANGATGVSIAATLNWASGGGLPTGYKLSFGTDNPPTNILNNSDRGNVLTYAPALMVYSTTYYWKVVAYNGFGDTTGTIWSFTTMADPTQPLPYTQDFNASTSLPAGWTSDMSISATHGAGGTNGLYRNLYSSVLTCYAMMPPVGPVISSTRLLFDYRIVKYSGYPATPDTLGAGDSLNVLVSTNSGGSYTLAYSINQTNHIPTTSFANLSVALGSYVGPNVVIRFSGKWGVGDYYVDIDNVVVDNAVAKDIQVQFVSLSPNPPYYSTTPITVSAAIRNNGTEPNPTSVPVTYKIGSVPGSVGDGTTQTFTPSWTGNVDTVTFTTTYTPGSTGSKLIGMRSFYAGDLVPANDSAKTSINVLPAGALFEDFTDVNALLRWKIVNNDGGTKLWLRNTTKYYGAPASASSDYESSTLKNDDWLITPKLVVAASDSFSFYHSARSTSFPESLYVMLSTTGNNPADFTTQLLAIRDATLDWKYSSVSLATWAGQQVYVAFVNRGLDEYTIYIDDITGPQVYVPAVDLAVTTFFQTSGLPTPEARVVGNNQSWSLATRESDMKPEAKLDTRLVGQNTSGTRTVNPTVLLSNVGSLPATDNLEAMNLKAAIKNLGLNAAAYTFNWKVGGVAQTPYSGPSVPSGSVDSANFSYNASAAGTYLTTGKITVAADEVTDNDSTAFRMRVYPASYTRTILDRGDNTVDTFIGWGDTVRSMVACVRFTAAENIRLRGLDMIYRTESKLSGTITVKVRAAGGSTDSIGTVLYSRDYTTADYFTGAGDYVMFPFDSASAPTIASGSDYWITVKMPVGIPYPGGAHNAGFTIGHSYYEASPDTLKLTPLIITTERCWIMRAIHSPASTTTTLNVALATGWNLISNPVTDPIPGDSVRQLYPTSLNAYAFEFSSGYVQRFRLANGKGYWGKFPAAISNPITGTPRTRDSISVVAGWNILGSISNPVDTSTIVSVPPGLRVSSWFGYASGYTAVTQLVPGKGYWVKSNAAGKFVLANPLVAGPAKVQPSGENVLDALHSLTITDSRGGSQTLYFGADAKNAIDLPMFVMPPAPPLGALDARFETADGGSMVRTHAAKVSDAVEYSVVVQSDAYPLTVTWKINGGTASYELTDGQGGQVFRAKEMTGEGTIKITNSEVNRFSVKLIGDGQLPAEFALSQNYPNPFNPTTSIKYALPVDSKLTMEVYNVVGQRVRTLVNDVQVAGYHVAEWDGTGNGGQQLASGVYFLRLSALGNNGVSFNEVRKLMMLK